MTTQLTPRQWPERLTRREAGEYLAAVYGMRFGPAALANAASKGTGPPYTRQGGGRTSYHRPDLDVFAAERMSHKIRSTSELRNALQCARIPPQTNKIGHPGS